jgi:hypothetical protein
LVSLGKIGEIGGLSIGFELLDEGGGVGFYLVVVSFEL